MFDLFFRKPETPAPSVSPPDDGTSAWPVVYRRMRGARNITLRLNLTKRQIMLSYPWRTSQREAQAFLNAQQDWLQKQIAQTVEPYRLVPGGVVPVYGIDRRIVHIPSMTRGVQVDLGDDTLTVTGAQDRVPRTVLRYLKNLAERDITAMATVKAAQIDKQINNLTLRDTSSRWGSCTSDGDLNFCWRLIMAPREVVDYVVGHEVAHLVHMHHKPSFWALCRTLTPYTTLGKTWLRQHGATLQVTLENS